MLVAFIVFINMQTVYVDVSVDTVIEAVYDDAGLSDMSEQSATELKKDYGININDYNEKLKAFADQKIFFYIEVNTPFDDENGNLPEEYTEDKVHLYAKYYKQWCEWFCENTIQK